VAIFNNLFNPFHGITFLALTNAFVIALQNASSLLNVKISKKIRREKKKKSFGMKADKKVMPSEGPF